MAKSVILAALLLAGCGTVPPDHSEVWGRGPASRNNAENVGPQVASPDDAGVWACALSPFGLPVAIPSPGSPSYAINRPVYLWGNRHTGEGAVDLGSGDVGPVSFRMRGLDRVWMWGFPVVGEGNLGSSFAISADGKGLWVRLEQIEGRADRERVRAVDSSSYWCEQ